MIFLLCAYHFLIYWLCCYIVEKGQLNWNNDMIVVLINQIILTPFFLYLILPHIQFNATLNICLLIFLYVFYHNICFYLIHRLLHTKILYKYVHYLHHAYINPRGWVALYSDEIEHLLLNLFPIAVGPICLGTSKNTLLLWLTIASITAVVSHHIKKSHWKHHRHFKYNYGAGPIPLDIIFGTEFPSITQNTS